MREKYRVVLDTNVLLSAYQSKKGASHEVLRRLAEDEFEIALSVPLVLEYEEILNAKLDPNIFSSSYVEAIVNYICKIGKFAEIFYLWRPLLSDPEDDHILELAISAKCSHIITYNKKDFKGAEQFGIQVIDAAEFLNLLKN